MSKDKIYISLAACCFALVCCFVPFILFLELGYVDHNEMNDNLIETKCKILDHIIKEDTCSENCNCWTSCDTQNHCTQHCQTCYYTCYDGYVKLMHNYMDRNYTDTDLVYNSYRHSSNVVDKLKKNYPIGTITKCYYESNNPYKIRLELHNLTVYVVFMFIFGILGVIIMCGTIFFFIFSKR